MTLGRDSEWWFEWERPEFSSVKMLLFFVMSSSVRDKVWSWSTRSPLKKIPDENDCEEELQPSGSRSRSPFCPYLEEDETSLEDFDGTAEDDQIREDEEKELKWEEVELVDWDCESSKKEVMVIFLIWSRRNSQQWYKFVPMFDKETLGRSAKEKKVHRDGRMIPRDTERAASVCHWMRSYIPQKRPLVDPISYTGRRTIWFPVLDRARDDKIYIYSCVYIHV